MTWPPTSSETGRMDRYRLHMGQACLAVEIDMEPGFVGGVPLPPDLNTVLDMHRLVLALVGGPSAAAPAMTSGMQH